jgi:Tfp pilus assembly protein PilF
MQTQQLTIHTRPYPLVEANNRFSTGDRIYAKGRLDGAITCYRQALALDPKYAQAHFNLGLALHDKGQLDQAIACYQHALALDSKDTKAHTNLGLVLFAQGQWAQASASFRQALALDPKDAQAHTNLGNALAEQGQLDQASACYRQALALDPKLALAHNNLGIVLSAKGELDRAIACWKKALVIDPKYAPAHYSLGNALKAQGQVAQAIACYRQAIILDPKSAEAHCNLGLLLQQRGQFTEALATLRRGHQLGSRKPRWPYPSALWVRQAQRWLHLDAQLPKILQGTAQPASAAERLEYVQLCRYKQQYAFAARFYADAFTADPKLAGDLKTGHRYNAARYAALAATLETNANQLSARQRRRWRQQAQAWLRKDLELWDWQLKNGQPQASATVQQTLGHWQRDPALAAIRDAAWIVNLPADELRACRKLWDDVDQLLKRAAGDR